MRPDQKQKLKAKVYDKAKGKCAYCGIFLKKDDATLDHYLPRAQGGQNTVENCRLACHPCNNKKGSMTPWEWINHMAKAA